MKECPNKLGLRHLHPNPYLQVMKNVSIVVLMVMTLTIVTHCIQNFILTNLPTTRMVEAKEDVGEAMALKQRGKPQIKFQVRPTTKAKVMA
jgi:hypothetical protein